MSKPQYETTLKANSFQDVSQLYFEYVSQYPDVEFEIVGCGFRKSDGKTEHYIEAESKS